MLLLGSHYVIQSLSRGGPLSLSALADVGTPALHARLEPLLDDLIARGWSEQRAFLDPDWVRSLREEADADWRAGEFRAAAVGRGKARRVIPDVRGDAIHWLEPASARPAQLAYLELLGLLQQSLSRALFVAIERVEAHSARYPVGAGYARHLDRFAGSDERIITCVLYLNDGWTEGDGGELVLEVDGAEVEVQPRGGTVAVFITEGLWHTVRPVNRVRHAITAWFRQPTAGWP